MNGIKEDACARAKGALESDSMAKALSMLFRAARFAADANRDIWDFAIETHDFFQENILSSDLRWLLAHGYVVHAQEITQVGESARKFLPLRNLAIPERTCFVLTTKGGRVVNETNHVVSNFSNGHVSNNTTNGQVSDPLKGEKTTTRSKVKPHWDAIQKRLSFADQEVKRFRRPAPIQETILRAFQEEQWPLRIDDPLSQLSERIPSRRLQDAIKALNRHHSARIIRFHGDGEGKGVLWEVI